MYWRFPSLALGSLFFTIPHLTFDIFASPPQRQSSVPTRPLWSTSCFDMFQHIVQVLMFLLFSSRAHCCLLRSVVYPLSRASGPQLGAPSQPHRHPPPLLGTSRCQHGGRGKLGYFLYVVIWFLTHWACSSLQIFRRYHSQMCNDYHLIHISLKLELVMLGPVGKNLSLVEVMVWHQTLTWTKWWSSNLMLYGHIRPQ